jgi:hypothetical protein
MKKLIALIALILSTQAMGAGDAIYLPNLSLNATGTTSGGKHLLDVNLAAGSVTTTIASEGVNGAAAPADALQVGGNDGTNLRAFSVDSTGKLNINNISGTVVLPTGASTSLLQTTGNTSLSSIDGKIPSGLTVTSTRLLVDASGTTQPVSGTVTVVQPTGTSLHAVLDATSTTDVTQSTASSLNATVVQATGTNLHTVVDSGSITANAGTNLNTSALALEATLTKLPLTQGSTTSGQSGTLVQGAVTTAAPSYTTAQTSPLSLTTAGALRVDGSATTQPVSGTVTANIGTSGSLALDASVIETHGTKAAGTAATKSELVGGVYSSTLPVLTTGQQAALQSDTSGRLIPGVGGNGSGSAAAATVSTVITLTAPAGANGFVLMNIDTSTANVRWAIGRTATATLGQQLQPGRDTGFVPCSHDVSLVAESGTQTYDIQWISQ